ncbi:MAG: cyclic nucleotide-binding domain-containing protein [Candidatus Cloacimonetes bacterium]|nr:cyclic nucleotide-binding domain-containing protein [Candidatus Cloacimonadota bacterium]
MFRFIFRWLKSLLFKPDKNAALRRFSIFKKLDSFELYQLNNFLHKRSFKAGELLFDKDYPLEMIFFIEQGEIEVLGNANPRGHSVLKKNQWIGIMDMFHENIRSSSAKALTEVQALAISRFDLNELINKNPHMGVTILTGICESLSKYIFQSCEHRNSSNNADASTQNSSGTSEPR